MEKKSSKKIIGLIALLLIVLIIIVALLPKNDNSTDSSEVENVTDMSALKQSEYTNDAFDSVELGDSKADVESKMGSLQEAQVESEYDVYSFEDEGTSYFFYFDGDKLENVSVFLDEA